MLQAYRQHVAERAALGIPPLPLTATQTAELIDIVRAEGVAYGAEPRRQALDSALAEVGALAA